MDPGPIFTIDTSYTFTCLLAANHHYLPHHLFNPLLQQTGELENLTDSLGQSLEFVLCRSPRCLQLLCDVSFLLLVITSVSTEGRLAVVLITPCSWGFQRSAPRQHHQVGAGYSSAPPSNFSPSTSANPSNNGGTSGF